MSNKCKQFCNKYDLINNIGTGMALWFTIGQKSKLVNRR